MTHTLTITLAEPHNLAGHRTPSRSITTCTNRSTHGPGRWSIRFATMTWRSALSCWAFRTPHVARAGGDIRPSHAMAGRRYIRIWLDPDIQRGGFWCEPGVVPGYSTAHGIWRPTVATWAIDEVLSRVQADRVRLWPPVYPDQPYHIFWPSATVTPVSPRHHLQARQSIAHVHRPHRRTLPGPSGKYGWAWRLPRPQWAGRNSNVSIRGLYASSK